MMKYSIVLLVPLLFACDETEECKELRAIKSAYERAVAGAKARVSLKGQSEKRLAKREKAAKERLAQLGLDLPETKLKEELDRRVAKIPGAKIERTTRPVSDAATGSQSVIHETLWRIQFDAKNYAEAFEHTRMLAKSPPLFHLVTVLEEKKGSWLVELMRASVIEVSMNIPTTPLPKPKSPTEVEEVFGFCGAGDLRAEIAELEKQFDEVKAEAEALSVVMPKVATYEGLERRATLLGEVEMENRTLIDAFLTAVQKAKLRFKAVGVEREVVIYEIYGGQKDRARLEKHLPEELLKGMKELDTADKNVVRLSVVNRVSDQQIKRGSGAMRPGVGLAPEKGP